MIHFDTATVRQDTLTTTTEGFLKGTAVVTRTGIFKYENADGSTRHELRLAEDVFKKDSLETIQGIPVTVDHPPAFVDSRNSDKFSVGFTGEQVTVDGNELIINFTITNQDAINTVRGGKQALSLGYEVDLEIQDGEHEGKKFDAKQTNIRYNHLAIVDTARAGRNARIKLDGYGEYAVQINDDDNTLTKGKTMIVKINGVDHDLPEDAAKAVLKQQKADADALVVAAAETSKQKARGDDADEKLHLAKVAETARLDTEALATVIESVKSILPTEYKFDDKTIQEIQKATILVGSPDVKLDDQDAVYIQARFDLCLEAAVATPGGVAKQRAQMIPKDNNDGVPMHIATGSGRRDGFEELSGKKEDAMEDARKRMDTIYCRASTIPNPFEGNPNARKLHKRILEGGN